MKEVKNRYHDRVIADVLGSIIKLDIEPYEELKTFTKGTRMSLTKAGSLLSKVQNQQ